jgi:hypothetical protein
VTIYSSFFFIDIMCQPNRASSCVRFVVIKESDAHCKAVLFLWLCGLTIYFNSGVVDLELPILFFVFLNLAAVYQCTVRHDPT